MTRIRPVFDPAIPVEVRDALLARVEGRRPDRGAPSSGSRGQIAREVVRALAAGAVCGLLPAVLALTRMLGLAGRVIAMVGQAGLVLAWLGGYFLGGALWPGIIATLAVQLTCTACVFTFMPSWQLRRGIRQARGRYLMSNDFNPEALALLARAQAAIGAVAGARTVALGFLDEVANDVVLSWQEWEIAQALARRDGSGRHYRGGADQALVARRVEALERYAAEVRDADAAWSQQPGTLPAASAAELVALAEIEDLAESARRVRDAIRADLPGAGENGSRPLGPRRDDR